MIRGLAPVAINTTSASYSLMVPSAAVALMRCRASPGVGSTNSPRAATRFTPTLRSWAAMSADCSAASRLTRAWICGSEILASSMSMSKPIRGARRSSVRSQVEAMNVLDGTQSSRTAAPPMPSESITVTSVVSGCEVAATSAAS